MAAHVVRSRVLDVVGGANLFRGQENLEQRIMSRRYGYKLCELTLRFPNGCGERVC